MPNKNKFKYIGERGGMPFYEGSVVQVNDRTQAPVNRKPIELPAFEVNYQFPKSVRKSAKKGMKNLNLKSSRKAKK